MMVKWLRFALLILAIVWFVFWLIAFIQGNRYDMLEYSASTNLCLMWFWLMTAMEQQEEIDKLQKQLHGDENDDNE